MEKSNHIDEQTIVKKAQEGDKNAFNQLMEKYQQKIYQLAYAMTGNEEDAYDITQNSFLKAYNALNSFKMESSFYTWIYRIAYNTSINHNRRRKIFSPFSEVTERTFSFENEVIDSLTQEQINKKIAQALNRLPLKSRTVFILHFYENQSFAEISKIMNRNINTIKSLYSYSLKKLKKIIRV
ncbi:RNA polymerase sigma factor [bacterium]|nr:RNA polymerase sigma factor [bacterium]